MKDKLINVCRKFRIIGEMVSYEEIKVGNVNCTYKVNFTQADNREKSYIVQSINTYVFKNPIDVMENIDQVTEHIRAKKTGQPALHFHHTEEGKTYFCDESGFWRLFNYITSDTYNITTDLEVVRNAGEAFGKFQMSLSDFEASKLFETIPDFHDTRKRFEKLWIDVKSDPYGKAANLKDELEWLRTVENKACCLIDLYHQGKLPLRVTHNDTKINNVLFDKENKTALVVIDLDTVMPGLIGNDFGDAIRFAANYVEEDSPECKKAGLNMDVFASFTDGFLKHTAKILTDEELQMLPLSCFALAVELSTRFLDDYILGNPYFKINYPEHNLARARCQIALAKDMLLKMEQMESAVRKYAKKYI